MSAPVRLRSSTDIRAVFANRCAAGTTHVVAHARRYQVADHVPDGSRVAVVAGRRVGNAVRRNRAKRRIRACLSGLDIPSGFDVVISGKTDLDPIPFQELRADVASAVRRATKRVVEASR